MFLYGAQMNARYVANLISSLLNYSECMLYDQPMNLSYNFINVTYSLSDLLLCLCSLLR